MKYLVRKVVGVVIAICLVTLMIEGTAEAKTGLNKKSCSVYIGSKTTIKLSGGKSVKWSVSNGKIRINRAVYESYISGRLISIIPHSQNGITNVPVRTLVTIERK